MKARFTLLLIITFIATNQITACKGASTATVSANNSLLTATRLAVGTLKLENTKNAVTASQASQLLTLWEAYQSLRSSDTASQLELEALVKQIQGVMTSEQIKAIDTMDLTQQSVSELLQAAGANAINAIITPAASTSNTSMAGPGGMPPDGGMQLGDVTGGISSQSTPAASQSQPNTQTNQVNAIVLNTLIKLLETRSQTAG